MIKIKRVLGILTAAIMLMAAFGGCSAKPAQDSANRLDAIIARGYLEVVTEPYFAPNEFIDPSKSGNDSYVGSDIELARYIADDLGVELRVIPLEFSAVLAGVTEGKYDMAISALAYTPAREEAMNLSKGYHFPKGSLGHGLLIREDDIGKITGPESVSDLVVVAQSGSLQELFVNQQIPEYKEFKRVSATTDGFLMVQENKADVCVTNKKTAQLYIDANTNCGLIIVEDFTFAEDESTQGTRIGMPLGEDELTARINKIIDEVIKSGIYDEWYEEYSEYASSLGL